ATGTSSPLTVMGLVAGTSYTFTVTATNTVGTGPASSPSNAISTGLQPGAPTGIFAIGRDGSASVSFAPPSSDGGAAISRYTATASPGGASASGTGSPLVVTSLTNGTTYTFTVTATNANGTGPASSPSNAIVPIGLPEAPTGIGAVGGDGYATV